MHGHAPHLGPLDWDRTVARAEHERLAPLLSVALGSEAVPEAARRRLRAAWSAAQRQHLAADRQLREIVGAFGDAGLEAIVLKGPALAAYYPEPALRPFTDVDLLVRRRDRAAAIDVLAALGYAHASPGRSLAYELEHAAAACFAAPPGAASLPIDLHWKCIAHPGGGRATELAAEELWSRAVPAPWGAAARALATEDLVVYLAAHLAIHHALVGVLWQLDLALVLRRHAASLDWDAVCARAHRWRAATATYFALRAVERALDVPPARSAHARLSPGRARVAVVEALERGGPERMVRLEYVVGLLLLDRLSDVMRVLARGAAPWPRWLRTRYGRRSLLAAYLIHYGRLLRALLRASWPGTRAEVR